MENPMKSLRIYSDTPFDPAMTEFLKTGISPHELVFPAKMAESVLGKSEAGPEFALADIAFGQPDVEAVLNSKNLRWVHLSTAGYTRYDTPEFREAMVARGVPVSNSSGVYADACVEHVLAFMLAQARMLVPGLASRCAAGSPEWFGLREGSVPMRGQRVVILGYGVIAARLVEVLAPFQMEIMAMRRSPRGSESVPVFTPDGLQAELSRADHVVNILPDNAESAGFMSTERLGWMKSGAAFYNIGRGGTVDQDALAGTLESGRLGAAWLDVTDPEPLPANHRLRSAPNCHITPHTAGGHRAESHSLVRHFLENLRRFQSGDELLDRIM